MTNTQITALISNINDGGANTASEVRNVLTAIKNACVIPNEIKWIKMSNTNLAVNFQSSGSTKGLGLVGTIYEGWAICNGNNGTTNDDGLVSIAYGTNYATLDNRGGSKDAVLIGHTHNVNPTEAPTYGSHGADRNTWGPSAGDSAAGGTASLTTTNAGGTETGVGKNMQPYIVELKIQRIA